MAYSTPPSLTAGQTLTAAHMNLLRTAFEEVARPPQIQAYSTASQSIPSGTLTALNLQATYSIRGFTIASSVMTVPESGMYLVVCNVRWQTNGTGIRYVAILVNSTISREDHEVPSGAFPADNDFPFITNLSATNTVTVSVYQNSGSALDAVIGARVSIGLMAR